MLTAKVNNQLEELHSPLRPVTDDRPNRPIYAHTQTHCSLNVTKGSTKLSHSRIPIPDISVVVILLYLLVNAMV